MTNTPRFDAMMATLKANVCSFDQEFLRLADDDKKLILLFEKHKNSVSAHFEACVPSSKDKWTPKFCSRAEWHGPQFHKGFRQWAVTGSAEDDVAIWKLLSGDTTSFWSAHQASMQD